MTHTPASDQPEHGSTTYVVLICLVAALGGLLFGYDTAVIAGAIGFLQEHYELDPILKGWASSSALVGCILGAAFAGMLSDGLGRKKVLLLSAVFFFVSAVGTALPRSLTEFVIYRIIGGIGVGAASMTSPMYIAEVSPAHIRGRLVSVNQFAIITGMVVVSLVNYYIARYGANLDGGAWNVTAGWRWMFGSEALPASLLLILLFFVPESPRWLAKQGRKEKALRVLSRVNGRVRAQWELEDIDRAIAQEGGSVAVLFQPGLRVVLVIGVVLAVLQQITGINVFLYFAPEILKGLGTTMDVALLQTILVNSVNLLFTIIAIWSVDLLGRKPLMILGAAGMGINLLGMSYAAYIQTTATWVLFCILGYIASFALSLGPVTWVILSEIFPTRIRGRAMAIATVCLWVANTVVTQTFPMIDENPWLVQTFHHAASFWIFAVMCAVTVAFVWRFVPETKGKSLEEIEAMWGITHEPAGEPVPAPRTVV